MASRPAADLVRTVTRGRTAARTPAAAAPAPAPGLSLTQQAYAEIKHRIMTLGFKPGEFLNEGTICERTGFGRTPVHEALHLLKLEGLVEIIPRRGIMIRPDSLNDVIALLEARMIIEPQCMALAAERARPHHLQALEQILREHAQALARGDHLALISCDARFHEEVVSAAGNSALADVMRLLHQRISRIWRLQVWMEEDLQRSLREHHAILAALRRGDRDAATSAAQIHLTSLKRQILHRAA